jgi:hypothetical protein
MALQIPSWPNPHDKANPLVDVYGWFSGLNLDLFSSQGQVVLNVNPNAAAWQDKPIDQLGIALGQVLGPDATFKTLAEFMADAEFAAAFATIGAKLYAEAVAKHPMLAGAIEV